MNNGNSKTLLEQFKEYLKTRHYSDNTVYNYMLDIRNFLQTCNIIGRIESVGPTAVCRNGTISAKVLKEEIDKYFGTISGKLSQRSLYRHTKSLKLFFKFLTLNDILDEVPNIPRLKFIPRLPQTLDEEHIKKMFSVCEQVDNPYRMKSMLSLLYGCGLRVSELVNIKLSDCDFTAKFIKVYGKNRRERIIPLSDKIINIIQLYIEKERKFYKYAQTGDYLFLSRKRGKISRIQVFNLVKKLQEVSGIDRNIHPHLLRHSFATRLLENGVSLRVIQELLGHSKLSTTTVYTHVDYKKLQEIYDKYF